MLRIFILELREKIIPLSKHLICYLYHALLLILKTKTCWEYAFILLLDFIVTVLRNVNKSCNSNQQSFVIKTESMTQSSFIWNGCICFFFKNSVFFAGHWIVIYCILLYQIIHFVLIDELLHVYACRCSCTLVANIPGPVF